MKFEIIVRQTCHVSYVVLSTTQDSLKHIRIHVNSLYKANQNVVLITPIHLFWSIMSYNVFSAAVNEGCL
jgi:hypothetical protein